MPNMSLEKNKMPHQDPSDRITNFDEVETFYILKNMHLVYHPGYFHMIKI